MSTSKTRGKKVKKNTTEEPILTRWSRRKQLATRHALDEQKSPAEYPLTPETPTPKTLEYKTDADMPPIESITTESNLTDFFSPKVSEALRQQALRKLFHLPVYNITDGLNDYDEDYTRFTSLGDIVTAEMRHQIKQEAKRALTEAELEQASDKEDASEQVEESSSTATDTCESPSKDPVE